MEARSAFSLPSKHSGALLIHQSAGQLCLLCGLGIKAETCVDAAKLIVSGLKLWIQFDDVFQNLARSRPILLSHIDFAQLKKRIEGFWLKLRGVLERCHTEPAP